MEDKRKRINCSKCGRSWLIETTKAEYKGNQKQFLKRFRRMPGHCYCGTSLYKKVKNE